MEFSLSAAKAKQAKMSSSVSSGKSSIISWKETNNFKDTFESWKKVKNNTTLKEYLSSFDRFYEIFNICKFFYEFIICFTI